MNVGDVNVSPGTTITFRVRIPGGQGGHGDRTLFERLQLGMGLQLVWEPDRHTWHTLTLTVPSGHTTPLKQLGLRFSTNAAWTGTCYIDSVAWGALPPLVPTGFGSGRRRRQGHIELVCLGYGHHLQRQTLDDEWQLGHTTISTNSSLTFIDTGVVNGTTYHYVVSAVNATGESPNSVEASAIPNELRALYSLDGNAQDSSGNSFHGTTTGLTYVAGKIGAQAAQFNGSGASVTGNPADQDAKRKAGCPVPR